MSTQPYNVEIFDRDYNYIQNYVVDDVVYNYDYLSIMENTVLVPFDSSVSKGDYIRIKNNEHTYYGVISSLSVDESLEGFTTIGYKPLMSLFDCSILFDVSYQLNVAIEETFADYITSYFISNSDSEQNISGLTVSTISSTTHWTFFITEDLEGGGLAITNLMEMMQLALTKYGIVVSLVPDFEDQTLTCTIGSLSIGDFVIEADLPNVIDKNIVFNQKVSDVNKLIVYDTEDLYVNYVTYYLHSDDTYDTTDSDRLTPVIYTVATAAATDSKTFADVALELADQQFGNKNKADNLIEIWISKEDTMVNPTDMEVGQWVTVIANGTSYESMLTGYEIGENIKLTFGTVRLDLTKILKRRL